MNLIDKAKEKVKRAYREILCRYIPRLERKIGGFYDRNVKIYLANLPPGIEGVYQRLSDGTKEILLNVKSVLFKPYSYIKRVLGHEITHNIQDNAGRLSTYDRRGVEIEAEKTLLEVAAELRDYGVANEIEMNSPYLLRGPLRARGGLSRCVKSIFGSVLEELCRAYSPIFA